jgi:hypothetical protein
MNITLPIKSNNDYSSWVYTPIALFAWKVVPAVSTLLPEAARQKLYNFLAEKEESIGMTRRNTGQYPPRTWYGLNGVDQYDLWADSTNAVSKTL